MSENSDRATRQGALAGCIDTAELRLAWSEAPWDTAVYGYPVLQITELDVRGHAAARDVGRFESARDAAGSGNDGRANHPPR